MNTQNICKFISRINEERIHTKNFVYETSGEKFNISKEYNIIHIVVSGNGTLVYENTEKEISSGDIFFTFSGFNYQILNNDNLKYMYISFDGNRSEELFERFGLTPMNNIFKGYENLISFWENAIAKAGEKNLDLISEAVLLYTFGEMAPYSQKKDCLLINKITKYIEDNFTDSKLSLQKVSDALGYNSKYVSRVFKDNMGLTFSSYLTNKRIQNATFLIEQGVTSIKNVAILSGYSDPLYFSNVFKKATGISPSQYIENKASSKQ